MDLHVDSEDWEHLLVGGKKFLTRRSTLMKEPGSRFSRYNWSNYDKSQAIRIDRDGTHFRHILNWLRDFVVTPDLELSTYHELLRETDFYRLNEMDNAIRKKLNKKREGNRLQGKREI